MSSSGSRAGELPDRPACGRSWRTCRHADGQLVAVDDRDAAGRTSSADGLDVGAGASPVLGRTAVRPPGVRARSAERGGVRLGGDRPASPASRASSPAPRCRPGAGRPPAPTRPGRAPSATRPGSGRPGRRAAVGDGAAVVGRGGVLAGQRDRVLGVRVAQEGEQRGAGARRQVLAVRAGRGRRRRQRTATAPAAAAAARSAAGAAEADARRGPAVPDAPRVVVSRARLRRSGQAEQAAEQGSGQRQTEAGAQHVAPGPAGPHAPGTAWGASGTARRTGGLAAIGMLDPSDLRPRRGAAHNCWTQPDRGTARHEGSKPIEAVVDPGPGQASASSSTRWRSCRRAGAASSAWWSTATDRKGRGSAARRHRLGQPGGVGRPGRHRAPSGRRVHALEVSSRGVSRAADRGEALAAQPRPAGEGDVADGDRVSPAGSLLGTDAACASTSTGPSAELAYAEVAQGAGAGRAEPPPGRRRGRRPRRAATRRRRPTPPTTPTPSSDADDADDVDDAT